MRGGRMDRKIVISILSVVISSIILGLGTWYLYKYFRRHIIIRAQKEADGKITSEIAELRALGFDEESDAVSVLESRYSSHRRGAEPKENRADQHSDLLALNKKMLMSYIKEGNMFKKQGIDPKSNLMKFTYDKIVRLTIAVVELKRQLRENETQMSEYEKRVERMREITRQSINHYKKTLWDYQRKNLAATDERIKAARSILTTRLKHLAALEMAVV